MPAARKDRRREGTHWIRISVLLRFHSRSVRQRLACTTPPRTNVEQRIILPMPSRVALHRRRARRASAYDALLAATSTVLLVCLRSTISLDMPCNNVNGDDHRDRQDDQKGLKRNTHHRYADRRRNRSCRSVSRELFLFDRRCFAILQHALNSPRIFRAQPVV